MVRPSSRTQASLIVSLEAATAGLKRELAVADGSIRRFTRNADREVGKLNRSFIGLSNTISGRVGSAIAGLATAATLRGIVNVNREYAKLSASLVTVTGSTQRATAKFKELQEFARQSPLDTKEVVQAYIRLSSLGLEPTVKQLNSLGNTAAAQGKRLIQFVEAVADASVNEFERLKEFGIKAISQGDDVAISFGGNTKIIKRNAEDITKTLLEIGNTTFAGALDRQAKTVDGALTKATTAFDELAVSVGEGGLNDSLAEVANNFADAVTKGNDLNNLAKRLGTALGALISIADLVTDAFVNLSVGTEVLAAGIVKTLQDLDVNVFKVRNNMLALAGQKDEIRATDKLAEYNFELEQTEKRIRQLQAVIAKPTPPPSFFRGDRDDEVKQFFDDRKKAQKELNTQLERQASLQKLVNDTLPSAKIENTPVPTLSGRIDDVTAKPKAGPTISEIKERERLAKRQRDQAERAAIAAQKRIDNTVAGLRFELSQLERNSEQQEVYTQLKQAGVAISSQEGQLIQRLTIELEREKRLKDDLKSIDEARQQLALEGRRVTEENLNAQERLGVELNKLDELYRKGAIDSETYRRAVDKATGSTSALEQAGEGLKLSFTSAFEDAIVQGEKLRDVFDGLVQDLIRIALRAAVIKPLSDAFAGIFTPGTSIQTTSTISPPNVSAFAGGGVMTNRGPLPLNKYAGGGIANSPQLALFGETSTPEAFVPVPNGRIPVDLRGLNIGGGGTTINIIDQRSGGGEIQQSEGTDQFGNKQIELLIIDAVARDVSNRGKFSQSLEGNYGVSRKSTYV